MRLTRVYRFSASHRLHAASLSDDENRDLYGKCNNPYGHGHDYTLHISVQGEADPVTGRLVNIGDLDRFVEERVLGAFDHQYINEDVADFRGVPTTENLAVEISRRLCDGWNQRFRGIQPDGIFIRETPRNTFELRNR